MKENTTNTDSTSMPTKHGALSNFPCIVEEKSGVPVKYGESTALSFPIGNGERVKIDPTMFRGKGTLRLLHIKQALKVAGKTNDKDGKAWFNSEVKKPWHKVLKFATRTALEHGTPVSLGLSRRTAKKTGQVTLTSKHGFEYIETPPTEKAVADKAEKQSKTRAKRQQRKRNAPMPGNSVRIDATASTAAVSTSESVKA